MIPGDHTPLAVEHDHPVSHIVEGHAQHGAAPLEFPRPFVDHLLEARRRLLALLEQALQLDCVAPKDLDRPAHCAISSVPCAATPASSRPPAMASIPLLSAVRRLTILRPT